MTLYKSSQQCTGRGRGGEGAQQCEHDVGVHKSIATDCEQAGRQAARAVQLTSDQRDPLTRHKWANTQLAGANNDQVSDGSLYNTPAINRLPWNYHVPCIGRHWLLNVVAQCSGDAAIAVMPRPSAVNDLWWRSEQRVITDVMIINERGQSSLLTCREAITLIIGK